MSIGMADRLAAVQERIRLACERSQRDPEAVTLVAVSKTYPPADVDALSALGCRIFGESRVQEAAQKISLCASGLAWHGIGHLQRNKVAPAIELFSRLHGVDSLRLLERIESCAADAGKKIRLCLEVNVSGESSKFGFSPAEIPAVLDYVPQLRYAEVDGLMTIAPYFEDPEKSRGHFKRLRMLRDEWVAASGWPLDVLSMGMSHDMMVAIEEGATMIRVGTALFGPRAKPEEWL
ncbi:MAG: YggS family pyridoxal phosphate-dependent enzyme [Kiritimatiellia bacterium]